MQCVPNNGNCKQQINGNHKEKHGHSWRKNTWQNVNVAGML